MEDLSPGTVYEFTILSVGTKNRINQQESEKLSEQTGMDSDQQILILICRIYLSIIEIFPSRNT